MGKNKTQRTLIQAARRHTVDKETKYIQDTDWWKETNRRIGAELDADVRQCHDKAILDSLGLKGKSMLKSEGAGAGKATPRRAVSTYESLKYCI